VARGCPQVALIAVLAVLGSGPAVPARGADCARCPSRAAAHLAQGDPRDPFGRDGTADSGSGADAGTSADAVGGATTSGSGVGSAGTLPLTGSTTMLLAVVAGLLLLAGGLALWTTRYRPRHAR
jgi:LPXTG-motif cell wall-anchored protein